MNLKLVMNGLLIPSGILMSIGSTAHADLVTTSGGVCHNLNAAHALDVDYLPNGVRNINAAARPVICSVPRLQVNTAASFFIDGHNEPNTITTCTVYVHSFLGVLVAAQTFVNPSSPEWDQFVTFAAGVVTSDDYVSVICTLPGGGAGLIHGITAVQ